MKITKKGCKGKHKIDTEIFQEKWKTEKREYGGNRCGNISEEYK